MTVLPLRIILIIAASLIFSTAWPQVRGAEQAWQDEFNVAGCPLSPTGKSRYFVLEPGFQLVLEGGGTRVQIVVTDETKVVDGVTTRVVEEREWKGGELYEVARNYIAICDRTKDVFYFGEDVEFYENGKVVRRDGSWLAGTRGNRAGLLMTGNPKTGMRYYQEVAPGVAMDRAEIVSTSETCQTPAGVFRDCLKVKEDSPLEPGVTEYKYHAPEVGLVQDEDLVLTRYGFGGKR
jgi:hypothetical protein